MSDLKFCFSWLFQISKINNSLTVFGIFVTFVYDSFRLLLACFQQSRKCETAKICLLKHEINIGNAKKRMKVQNLMSFKFLKTFFNTVEH